MAKLRNSWRNAFIIFVGMVLFIYGLIMLLGSTISPIGITRSASVNHFMFSLTPANVESMVVGRFVSFEYPEQTRRSGLLIKRIVGVEGDVIENNDGRIFLNGVFRFQAKSVSAKGRILKAIESQTIPHGYLFVAGDIKDSYDSRYDEFGLIAVSDVKKMGKPLW